MSTPTTSSLRVIEHRSQSGGPTRWYLTVKELGEGGFGTVFGAIAINEKEAELVASNLTRTLRDEEFLRDVATLNPTLIVKAIRSGRDEGSRAARLRTARDAAAREIRINQAMLKLTSAGRKPALCTSIAECVGEYFDGVPQPDADTVDDAVVYLVSDFTSSLTLSDYIDTYHAPAEPKGDDSIADASEWLRESARLSRMVADLVRALHVLGLIHQDIKPSNIIVTLEEGGGYVESMRFIDFGLSCFAELPRGKIAEELMVELYDPKNDGTRPSSRQELSDTLACWKNRTEVITQGTRGFIDRRALAGARRDVLSFVDFDDPSKLAANTSQDSGRILIKKAYVGGAFRLFDVYALCVTVAVIFSSVFDEGLLEEPMLTTLAIGSTLRHRAHEFLPQYTALTNLFALARGDISAESAADLKFDVTNSYASAAHAAVVLSRMERDFSRMN